MFMKNVDSLQVIARAWKLAARGALQAKTLKDKRWAQARASAFIEAAGAVMMERDEQRTDRKTHGVAVPTQAKVTEALMALVPDPTEVQKQLA
jgi:hypothetical protein